MFLHTKPNYSIIWIKINPEDNQQRRRSEVKEGASSSSLNHQPVLHPPLEHLYEICNMRLRNVLVQYEK